MTDIISQRRSFQQQIGWGDREDRWAWFGSECIHSIGPASHKRDTYFTFHLQICDGHIWMYTAAVGLRGYDWENRAEDSLHTTSVLL